MTVRLSTRKVDCTLTVPRLPRGSRWWLINDATGVTLDGTDPVEIAASVLAAGALGQSVRLFVGDERGNAVRVGS